ncbi:hypothetical protein [Streptomyces mobaraensis]|uniref:Uncharacterized protein n=1 Tax=Streptomyces mobaraensis TaxID=35621 RepID=A0A5N5W331_STRMB|nr:hypothetical protein [Streptomyces mobaraensis]KAB7835715.1 hypothetical protein FRZ00_26190 [Streptomyces mobaraensis]
MSLIGTRRVEVTWVFYPAIKNGLTYDGMPREVDEVVLADYASEPITSLNNQQDIERVLYRQRSPKGVAGRPIVEKVVPLCDCTMTAEVCRYADEFDGLRFRLTGGERIGHSRVYENIPDAAEGYPDRKLVGEVRTEFADSLLALVRETKGHK